MRTPESELDSLEQSNQLRKLSHNESAAGATIVLEGKEYLNFSSNDYLGLAQHPKLIDAAIRSTQQWGTGTGSSRLVFGSQTPSKALEQWIANAKGTEAALVFANGYTTSVGTLSALVGKGDTIILDKLSHASLIDGARLSGATIRVFPHNNLEKLEKILQSVRAKSEPEQRCIIVTEGVFSMDGDTAPLREMINLKNRYGAWLLVDEAHALGIYGEHGMGLASQLACSDEIELQMGTLGKAAGSAGGYLAASHNIIQLLVNKARSFIYSTAAPPAQYAAGLAALKLIHSDEGSKLRAKLWNNLNLFAELTNTPVPESSIIAWQVGDTNKALSLMQTLREDYQLICPAIRYPTVPRNTARLRITITASHSEEHIHKLATALLELSEAN
ncbi:aminotransferase class I/II-fold pyridoxal phosphate-dependent enzyme [Rubritalea marina]|uniref:aminotransferase class I/II-fold pyridoxal phosphate-dependent enzyme n=1 Tax=Rubritalea marina TaxID=361055 RepID=UPI0003695A84|nr:8-amino-7-oxononanoate synthase [Rubritalea marina]